MAKIPSPWGTISRFTQPDGRISYRLRGTIDGKRESFGVHATIEEARAQARSIADDIGDASTSLTLSGWGALWLKQLELEQAKAATDKRKVWGRYVEPSPLAGMPLRKIRSEHVRRWLDELARRTTKGGAPLGDQTMKNALYCLSAALRDAQRAGRASQNACRGVAVKRRGSQEDPWTYLTLAEIKRVLEHPALPARQRVIFGVAIYTGLRAGELWGLRWSDLTRAGSDPHMMVRRSFGGTTKGKRVRKIPLFPPALALLQEWKQIQAARQLKREKRGKRAGARIGGLVWPSRYDEMHTPTYDAQWAKVWRASCGIRPGVTLRDMRHTFASHLIMGSWGRAWRLEEIQQLLGHASRVTTERYAHLAPDAIQGAASEAILMWRPS